MGAFLSLQRLTPATGRGSSFLFDLILFLFLRACVSECHALVLWFKQRDGERVTFTKLKRLAERGRGVELANVNESGNPFLNRCERPVLVVLDDDTRNVHAVLVAVACGLPWVFLERLNGKGNLAF